VGGDQIRAPDGWVRLLSWKFDGPRAEGDGCDVRDLAPLLELRETLVEVARSIWRERHRGREVSADELREMAQQLELRILSFESGSCNAPLFAREDPGARRLFDDDPKYRTLEGTLPEAAVSLGEALRGNREAPGFTIKNFERARRFATRATSLGVTSAQLVVNYRRDGQAAVPADPDVVALDEELTEKLGKIIESMKRAPKLKRQEGWITEGEIKSLNVDERTVTIKERKTLRPVLLRYKEMHDQTILDAVAAIKTHVLRVRGLGFEDRSHHVTEIEIEEAWARKKPDPNALCEERFREFADEDPQKLLGLLPGLRPALLTYAAEVVGEMLPGPLAIPVLLGLLGNNSQLVREGAALGLGFHAEDPLVHQTLAALAEHEPNKGVREAAAGGLED